MAVKKYYRTFDGKVIEAIQEAEEMSPAEESALRNAIGGDFTTVESNTVQQPKKDISQEAPKKSVFTSTGRFRGADYKSGVTSNSFRFRFGNTNNFKERVNFLDKNVGKEGYVVDKLGDFLLTPKGQEKLGMEPTNNLVAIDSTKFEGEDIIDLAGEVLGPTVGSIAAFTAAAKKIPKTAIGRALVRSPYGGAIAASLFLPSIASAGGAYIGVLIDEAQQWARGISDEAISSIDRRGKIEATYAGVGDLVFGGLLRGLGRAFKGNSQKHLDAFYGKGANDPNSDAYSRIWKEYEETGKLTPEQNSMLADIEKGIMPDFYAKQNLDINLKHRLQLMAETIAGKRQAKLSKNVNVFREEMKNALQMTEAGKKILKQDDIDKYINKAIKDAFTTTTDDFVELTDRYTKGVHTNLRGALNTLLKLSDETNVGGPKNIDEIADVYNQIQDASAKTATEAIDVGQRIAKQGFEDIQDIFEIADVPPGTVKKIEPKRTPIDLIEGGDDIGLTSAQAEEIKRLTRLKEYDESIEFYNNSIQKNIDEGLLEGTVDNFDLSQAYKKGEFSETLKDGADVSDALPSNIIKAIDDEIKVLEKTPNLPDQDLNRLNYLQGIKNSDGLSVIKDKQGIPQFVLRYGENTGPQFIKTDDTIQALRTILNDQKGSKMFDSLEPGILKSLIKTIKNETNEPISLLSPMQHNELVQTLRKVVIADENIDLGTVWTAAIKDGEISYAQLGSAMSSVKKKGFEGIKKGSKEYKQKMQAIESLQDISVRSTKLMDEQRIGYQLFEEFGIGKLAQDVARKKQNSDVLINRLLSKDANPALIDTVFNTLVETTRRSERAMNEAIDQAEKVLPGYKKAVDKNVPTLQKDVPPLTSMDEGQQAATRVTEELAEEGDVLAKQAVDEGKLGERVRSERAVQATDEMNPELIGNAFRNVLVDNLLNKITANKNMYEFAEEIRDYASNGRVTGREDLGPSTLETILGKEATDDLIKIANAIENMPVSASDETRRAVQDLLQQRFTKLGESIRSYDNLGPQEIKDLTKNINEYADEVTKLRDLQNQEFAKRIGKDGFNINNENDVINLVNTMFDQKAFSTTELAKIFNKLDDGTKEVLREKYIENQITQALGVNIDEAPSIEQIGKIFNAKFISDLYQDPVRFNLIFGKDADSRLKNIVKMGKRVLDQNATGNFGQLVAATIAAAFAGLPVAVATGSIPLGAAAMIAAKYGGIRIYANAMMNPNVAKAIAEPRFFTPGSLNTSEKITLYQNGIMDAVTQMFTESDDIASQQIQAGQNKLSEEKPRGLSAVLSPITSLGIMPNSRSRDALKNITPKKQSYTPLPDVQDFRQTEDIFSEVNRRRALAGNNPNTQALIDRNR